MKYHFPIALLQDGWANDVLVDISDGVIQSIRTGVAPEPSSDSQCNDGIALPGLANVHSHAFQFGFAGLSEYRTGQHDSFWTWRKLMYEFLETLTPEHIYSIGKQLYSRMREAGYTIVGEFHYLLHQQNGKPYDNVNEMADSLIQAAIDSGLKICMLPVYYQRAGFDGAQLQGGQLRFGSSHDLYIQMLDKLGSDWGNHPNVQIGVAIHSLRAVSIYASQKMLQDVETLLPECPIHVHVAEQTQEVDDCLKAHQQRPVELLLNSFDVNQRWCLIHATHLVEDELRRVAESGAVVGVCPTTEANLGDGIFAAEEFLKRNGKLAIGSDSHISIDPAEELRLLEYGQRLSKRRRAVLCSEQKSCGRLLLDWASVGGAQATGFGNPSLAEGCQSGLTLLMPDNLSNGQEKFESTDQRVDHAIFHHRTDFHALNALLANG